ncbi:gamma-glutamyl-gamma-aminobutyrate hydrolase family protein [Gilvimarinus sp. SDUM040013]|uniref:Gamma-glutamyl-gamma-aminobutyrate hydrolase family protein n=1 Tax=Gilvimarinus gilvus TaxID=3058038 RepID=A0ABU4S1S6_9GAMM|nr:gamma-glutamyl-gamma-aminobutyrate hydrolase family protein [Gilvimarinus sp. SDUM040013]MDO3385456.1 gamma-glutamyl-gamma-aminobutyrate hydrolase family protein [Gilvimarinus sp. SDUM040013]MDX6851127.1 gamma-glutamyl-gamma-aminobutyrate hydrolase family protein [Gilvimarinus sp. SDUM040013]
MCEKLVLMTSIAIYNTDTIPESLARQHGQYPDMFMRAFAGFDCRLTFSRFDVNELDYPRSMKNIDGVLITGSKSAAYDSDPWIHILQEHIRELVASRVPVVGICFGHQVIHQALGGRVQLAQGGWCVGTHENQLVGADALFGAEGEIFRLLSSHQDQVVKMAPEFELLARTAYCPVAMTRLGRQVLTFQGHPEFTRDYAKALMGRRVEAIGDINVARALESLQQPLDDLLVLKWIAAFLRGSR